MTGAAFFDLDRTLLPRASGPALSEAMLSTGVVTRSLPFQSLLFGWFDHLGESLGSIALARQAGVLAKGKPSDAFDEAAELAAEHLAGMVQQFGRLLIEEHQAAGRPVILATTTPEHLIRPFAERMGLDGVIATRYGVDDQGRFDGSLDGPFVWSLGKRAAVREWSDEHGIDLAQSYAYSDSIYDAPLLRMVGHPHAINPDPRLFALAAAMRWPTQDFDTSPGVLTFPVVKVELQRVVTAWMRAQALPFARFEVSGVENMPAVGPAILVGNHRSYFDVPAMAVAFGQTTRTVRFLGKKELFDVPALGPILRGIGGISVDRWREGAGSDAFSNAVRAIRGGEVVGMMPEGTIPMGVDFFEGGLAGYPGAARLAALTGAPVIPFALWGTETVWPRSSKAPRLANPLARPLVRVHIGEPIPLTHRSVERDTERLLDGIVDLLPPEVADPPRPTMAELASTYPDGVVPEEDRWFAVDGD